MRNAFTAVLLMTPAAAWATLAPPAMDVPALGTWGLIGISTLLAVVGAAAIVRRRKR